jgi:hypothetical protein
MDSNKKKIIENYKTLFIDADTNVTVVNYSVQIYHMHKIIIGKLGTKSKYFMTDDNYKFINKLVVPNNYSILSFYLKYICDKNIIYTDLYFEKYNYLYRLLLTYYENNINKKKIKKLLNKTKHNMVKSNNYFNLIPSKLLTIDITTNYRLYFGSYVLFTIFMLTRLNADVYELIVQLQIFSTYDYIRAINELFIIGYSISSIFNLLISNDASIILYFFKKCIKKYDYDETLIEQMLCEKYIKKYGVDMAYIIIPKPILSESSIAMFYKKKIMPDKLLYLQNYSQISEEIDILDLYIKNSRILNRKAIQKICIGIYKNCTSATFALILDNKYIEYYDINLAYSYYVTNINDKNIKLNLDYIRRMFNLGLDKNLDNMLQIAHINRDIITLFS